MLDAVNPSSVIISVGTNSYGHPHSETLERFSARNINVYRTDEIGTIKITSDGTSYEINGVTLNTETTESIINENTELKETDSKYELESETASDTENYIVYITKTGSKYHKESCDSLSNSKIETTKQEAISQGYEPCKKCNP